MTPAQLERYPIAATAIGLSEWDCERYARALSRPGTSVTPLTAVAFANRMKASAAAWR